MSQSSTVIDQDRRCSLDAAPARSLLLDESNKENELTFPIRSLEKTLDLSPLGSQIISQLQNRNEQVISTAPAVLEKHRLGQKQSNRNKQTSDSSLLSDDSAKTDSQHTKGLPLSIKSSNQQTPSASTNQIASHQIALVYSEPIHPPIRSSLSDVKFKKDSEDANDKTSLIYEDQGELALVKRPFDGTNGDQSVAKKRMVDQDVVIEMAPYSSSESHIKNDSQIDNTLDVAGISEKKSRWKCGNGPLAVSLIVQKLKITDPQAILQTSATDLFHYLQTTGQLTIRALKLFSHCPDICSILMGPSFGETTNELNMAIPGPQSAKGCTVPLFHGFSSVKILDLACVPITDEDLRFIIRLPKLQALGLSATRITSRGIRYLCKYSCFTSSLKCLKLCYVDRFDDLCIKEIFNGSFESLLEIDFLGCDRLSLSALVDHVPRSIAKIRLPLALSESLNERHARYVELSRQHRLLTTDPELMDASQIRSMLCLHQRHYADIFLNVDEQALRCKLKQVQHRRSQEEWLYSISSDFC